jgi:ubiquitin conjugation factor E4 B
MKDPVLLPSSRSIVDRVAIHRSLLSVEQDPFNRQPLKESELIPQK